MTNQAQCVLQHFSLRVGSSGRSPSAIVQRRVRLAPRRRSGSGCPAKSGHSQRQRYVAAGVVVADNIRNRRSRSATSSGAGCGNSASRLPVTLAANELYPLGYSGYAGVVSRGVQVGSAIVAGLPSVSARLMAVIGRQKP